MYVMKGRPRKKSTTDISISMHIEDKLKPCVTELSEEFIMRNIVTVLAAFGIMFSAVPAVPAYAADTAAVSVSAEASVEKTDIEHLAGEWKIQTSDTLLPVYVSPTDIGTVVINKDGTYKLNSFDGTVSSGKVEFSFENIGGTTLQCISLYDGQERKFGGYYHSDDPDIIYYGNNTVSRMIRKSSAETSIKDFVGSWKEQTADTTADIDVSSEETGSCEIKADGSYVYTDANGKTSTGTVYVGDETIGGTVLTTLRFYNGTTLEKTASYQSARHDQLYFGNGAKVRLVRETAVKLSGDANCDGTVDMSDVVLVMQALSNPDKYDVNGSADKHLTEQGRINADIGNDGLTVGDAKAIQNMLLNK